MEKSPAAADLSVDKVKLDRILLVPGFCEPHCLMWPFKRALADCADHVEIWNDNRVLRKLDHSVARLKSSLFAWSQNHQRLSIVTHSFGDWITRQALAGMPQHSVVALASIAPIISASPIAKILRCFGGNCISEVPVMANLARASEFATVAPPVRRLVLWGFADAWARPFPFDEAVNQQVQHVRATHLSIVLQPSIHRRVKSFLTDRQITE
jgi:hypothetical protein